MRFRLKHVALVGTALTLVSILIGLCYKQLVNFFLSQTTIEAVAIPYESVHSPFTGTILMLVPNEIWVGLLLSLIGAAFVAGVFLCFLFLTKHKK